MIHEPSKEAPKKEAMRMPRFEYTGNAKVLHKFQVDMTVYLHVVGDTDNACYEWVLVRNGEVAEHSDCGYGDSTIALRDGLIAYHGLPTKAEA
jgi:hypothetical protein